MSISDFMRRVQAIYGSYNAVQADTVRTWLDRQRFSARRLDRLWAELTQTTDTHYNYRPSVACLNKIASRIAEEAPAEAPRGTLQIEDDAEDRHAAVAACFGQLRQKLNLRPWRSAE